MSILSNGVGRLFLLYYLFIVLFLKCVKSFISLSGDLLYRNATTHQQQQQQQQGHMGAVSSLSAINDAKEYFKRAILNGKHKESYLKLAEIYAKERDYMKAIEMYENCLQ